MTEEHDPYIRALKQTDDVLDHAVSVPANDNAGRPVAKLPYEPPVIETLYPTSTGLPPDVFEEWGGECMRRSETDDKGQHDLHSARSQWSVARWLKTCRILLDTLGRRHPKPGKVA